MDLSICTSTYKCIIFEPGCAAVAFGCQHISFITLVFFNFGRNLLTGDDVLVDALVLPVVGYVSAGIGRLGPPIVAILFPTAEKIHFCLPRAVLDELDFDRVLHLLPNHLAGR